MNDLKKALIEQESADRVTRAVESAEHYNYLRKKFGPRPEVVDQAAVAYDDEHHRIMKEMDRSK